MSSTACSARYALLDANNFYVSCERIFRPDLKNRPVIVLSNNDGCVISRSDEAKALGITMAQPLHQIKNLCRTYQIAVFSSNFALYADISQRVMATLENFCPDVEIYSIDEAFLDFKHLIHVNLNQYSQLIYNTLLKQVGIPVSIGFGPTKTLAKVATHIAKKKLKQPIFNLSECPHINSVLSVIKINEIWGVGQRFSRKLEDYGIRTALDLVKREPQWLRDCFGITLMRTALELQGTICSTYEPNKARQSIVCSRSFNRPQTDYDPIAEALSQYCHRAYDKLRTQHLVASRISVFLRTNHFKKNTPQYSPSLSMNIPQASQDVTTLIHYAKACLKQLYKPGYAYKKVGVCLTELSTARAIQAGLFDSPNTRDMRIAEKRMAVMDQINKKYQRDTLFLAAAGTNQSWQTQSNWRSPRYTTCWQELAKVS